LKAMERILITVSAAAILTTFSCRANFSRFASFPSDAGAIEKPKLEEIKSEKVRKLLSSANDQIKQTNSYDPSYVAISYPNGDVPIETGVCADVVVRAFRSAGVDLQKEVHEDMSANFSVYPNKWNLSGTDANIDHRRVPNMQTFFTRKGKSLEITQNADEYLPGDVVTWDLDGNGKTHTGLVSNLWNESEKRYLIIHNIGFGARAEDRLFDWKVTGHFRYFE